MTRYIIKRLLATFLSLWVVITVTFFLMKAIPGDPFTQEKALPQEILNSLYEHYKLNDPWYIQYFNYLKSIITWNLGPSFKYKARTVNEIIRNGFPISAILGFEALLIALGCGITLGTISAIRQHKWQDYGAMVLAVLGISVPSFIMAAFLQFIFAIKLDLLPVARWGTFEQSILPAISLAALPTAFIARLTRANMIEVLRMDYIKTARSKGISETKVIMHHTLRNALLPVVTYLGTLTANILTGSFIIEKIFGIPGLGQWFINSITNRDYTVIMGITVFYSILLLIAILAVDIIYGWIDPRIKLEKNIL
ncbi:MAG: ABC transporter permease [Chlamydiia bacterium]|nr:ABC transporter permease [Chlamydiia bacterium]